MGRNLSIVTRLILFATTLLLIPTLALGALSYFTAKGEVKDQMLQSASQSVYILNNAVTESLNNKTELAEMLANQLSADDMNENNAETARLLLSGITNSFEDISLSFAVTDQGRQVTLPQAVSSESYDLRTRDWYKEALQDTERTVITSPYENEISGEMIVTVAQALEGGGGVIGFDVNLDSLKKSALSVNIGEKGYAAIFDAERRIAVHPLLNTGNTVDESITNQIFESEQGHFTYEYEGSSKEMVFSTNPLTGWKIVGALDTAEFAEASQPILIITLSVIGLFAIIGSVYNYFNITSIVRPIRQLVAAAEKVSKGDLTATVNVQSSNETGRLGNAFNMMVTSLSSLISKANDTSNQLAASSQQLSSNSEAVTAISRQMTKSIDELSDGAVTQMKSAEETARAMEEIASGVQYIASKTTEAGSSAVGATAQAEAGTESIQKAIEQMAVISQSVEESSEIVKQLNGRSKEIDKIIEVITAISEQTNLLALNAAIEAARAGEHGKGFAVVAEEVRKLAEGSKTSAEQIAAIITGIQADTERMVITMNTGKIQAETGMEIMAATGEKFKKIYSAVNDVNVQIQEVSATSEQMSASAQEISASVEEVAGIASESAGATQAASSGAQEQLAAMEEIQQSVQYLSKAAQELKEEISRFKT
ncbi:HAMP domain-containing protein [Bacillus lacus]|uniref:HAMP domain-containing protein n=1 Tax=Metabacillus lacus TaxID=1983721 RepID=A0A7X2LXB2_9BACI|nr:methyl-accepting chemotaxis protein [Metabacillus lacus]MRX72365.1 HAMP domain-containing protein [Metabacillus lacus]